MLTLLFQTLLSVLRLAFGWMAMRVARRLHDAPATRAWLVSGMAFFAVGVHALVQDTFAILAVSSGAGSYLWDTYIEWAPALNHSRQFAIAAFFPLLFFVANGSVVSRRRTVIYSVGGLSAAMVLGYVVGWKEGALIPAIHFRAGSILDVAELLIALVVLFSLLVRSYVDRLLWTAVALYAFSLSLSAIWTSALVGMDSPGSWTPPPVFMHVFRAVLGLGMVLIAAWRLSLAGKNVPVRSLLEGMDRTAAPSPPMR